jgi:hypothetical protein
MKRASAVLWGLGALTFLGITVAGMAMPTPGSAGGIHLSIGVGIPFPVAVVPAPVVVAPAAVIVQPAPIIVQQPPVVVAPAPVLVQPAPVFAYPPPVVVAPPVMVYPPYRLPGFARPFYGDPPGYEYRWARHWEHRHHDDD